jgi:tRNA pseudouridine65 synthase
VRRHLKHANHPLIGDANYGKGALNRAFAEAIGLRRLALHALAMRIAHPLTGEPLSFEAPLPEDLTIPFARLGLGPRDWSPRDWSPRDWSPRDGSPRDGDLTALP